MNPGCFICRKVAETSEKDQLSISLTSLTLTSQENLIESLCSLFKIGHIDHVVLDQPTTFCLECLTKMKATEMISRNIKLLEGKHQSYVQELKNLFKISHEINGKEEEFKRIFCEKLSFKDEIKALLAIKHEVPSKEAIKQEVFEDECNHQNDAQNEETSQGPVQMSQVEFLAQLGLAPSQTKKRRVKRRKTNEYIQRYHFVNCNPKEDAYMCRLRSQSHHLCRLCVNKISKGKKRVRRCASCEMCLQVYTPDESYDEHMRKHHFPTIKCENSKVRYFCPCGITLSNFFNFRRHVIRGKIHPKHEQDRMTWKCYSCSSTFFGGEKHSQRKEKIKKDTVESSRISRLRNRATLVKSWKTREYTPKKTRGVKVEND